MQLLFCIPENLSFLVLYAWLAALKLNNKMLIRVLLLFCGQNPVNFSPNGSFISVLLNLFFHRAALWSKCKSHGPHSCHLHVTSSIQTNQIYNIIYSLNIIISKRLHLFKSIILLTNNKKHLMLSGTNFVKFCSKWVTAQWSCDCKLQSERHARKCYLTRDIAESVHS